MSSPLPDTAARDRGILRLRVQRESPVGPNAATVPSRAMATTSSGLVGGGERGDVELGTSEPGSLGPTTSGRGPDFVECEGEINDVFNTGCEAVELPLAGRGVGFVRGGKATRFDPAPEDARHAERGKTLADPSPRFGLAVKGARQYGQHGDPDDIELKLSQIGDGGQQPVLGAARSDGLGEGADGGSCTPLQCNDVDEALGFFEIFVGA